MRCVLKNIILGITGGIAAYKSAMLARLLVKAGYDVRVIMTEGAKSFITPLTLQALTGNEVHTSLLDETAEAGMGHIELAKWADLMIVAPASANTLARLAAGMADDLLATACLATSAPIMLAPAMNQQMWANAAVQMNVEVLIDLGYEVIAPDSGEQACGDVGAGRLPEPQDLFEHIECFIKQRSIPQLLAGKNVTITAGATVESIDPVRYLSNHSTGKMGFALAKACRDAGANVTLIAGSKVTLPTPYGVNRIDVGSAEDMLDVAKQCAEGNYPGLIGWSVSQSSEHSTDAEKVNNCCGDPACGANSNTYHTAADIFIATAAVADYRTREVVPQKIKKTQDAMMLDLVKNPDILATISHEYPHIFMVGFAAETQDVEKYAKGKLEKKKLDMIACNDVSRKDIGFASDDNAMTVYFADKYNTAAKPLEKASKDSIASSLVTLIGGSIIGSDK